MGGVVSRIRRGETAVAISQSGTAKEGGKRQFHLDRLPLGRILGFLDDTDVSVLRGCNTKVVFGCGEELRSRFSGVDTAELEWIQVNVDKSVKVLQRSVAAWLAKLIVNGNAWLLPRPGSRPSRRPSSVESGTASTIPSVAVDSQLDDVDRAVIYLRSIKGKYATMPELALSLVQGCTEEEEHKVLLHERLFHAHFAKFKRMHIDRQRLQRFCEMLDEELNKNGGDALQPLVELGLEWSDLHEESLKPLVEKHCEQQGMGFIQAYTKRELLSCLKKAVSGLIQQCSKQTVQARKKLGRVLSTRSFPQAVSADDIALELAQKLKALYLSTFLTDDALYPIVAGWVESYLVNKQQTLATPLNFFDPHMTYAEILRIEAATEAVALGVEKKLEDVQQVRDKTDNCRQDRRNTRRVKKSTKTTALAQTKSPSSSDTKKQEKRKRVNCITHKDVEVPSDGLVWLERQVVNHLDCFIGPFTTTEVKDYDRRKVNAVETEEGTWVRCVIASFRQRFNPTSDIQEEPGRQRQFCNIYHFLLRSYINYAIMRSHAVKPPKDNTRSQSTLVSALQDAIQRDFGSPSLLGIDQSWPGHIPGACPFVQAATTYTSFIRALVSMGAQRYKQWLQEKQDSMQQFAKSFANAVAVDSDQDGLNLMEQAQR